MRAASAAATHSYGLTAAYINAVLPDEVFANIKAVSLDEVFAFTYAHAALPTNQ